METTIKEQIFSGYFERNLDDKGRVAIPARLRSQLSQAQDKDEIIYVFYNVVYNSIKIYTYDGWITFVQPKIDAIKDPDERNRMMKKTYRFLEEQKMDAQGRILLNRKLAKAMGIEKGVSICGVGRGIEISALTGDEDDIDLLPDERDFIKDVMF